MKKNRFYSLLLGVIIFPISLIGDGNFISQNKDEYKINIKRSKEDLIINDFETGTDYGAIVANDSLGNDLLYTWGNNEYNSLGRTTDLSYDSSPDVVEFKDESGVQMSHGEYDIKDLFFTKSTSYAVLTYGGVDHLYGWGRNDYGQIGLGNNSSILEPTLFTDSNEIGSILNGGGEVVDVVGFDEMTTFNIKDSDENYFIYSVGEDIEDKGLFAEASVNSSTELQRVFTNYKSGDVISGITITPFSASVIIDKDQSNVEEGELSTELWVWGYEGGNNIGTLLPPDIDFGSNISPTNIASTTYFPELNNSEAKIKFYVSNPWNSIAVISPGNGESDILRVSGTSNSIAFTNSINYFAESNISSHFEALESSKGSTIEDISIVNNVDGTTNLDKYGKATMLISVIDGESGRNLVYTWGKNTNGLFGSGETNESVILGDTSDDVPNEISDLFPYYNETTRFTNIGITETFGYAFATTDGVSYSYTWGENTKGQFGNGETSSVISTTPQLTVPEATFEVNYSNITTNSLDINFGIYFKEETDIQSFDSFEISGTGINNSTPNYTIETDQEEPTMIETGKYGYTGLIHVSELNNFTTYDDWFLTLKWTSPVSLLGSQTSSYKIPSFSTIKNTPTLDEIVVENVSSTSVKVSWNLEDQDDAITSMSLNHPGVGLGSTTISGLNEIIISSLDSNTSYSDWTINYTYNIEDGVGSIPIEMSIPEFRTIKTTPSISNLQVNEVNQDSVNISWGLEDSDSSITSIILNHPDIGVGYTNVSGLSEVTIDNLDSNTTYSDWNIEMKYDLNDGEGEKVKKEYLTESFSTDYKINDIDSIQASGIELLIELDIDGDLEMIEDERLNVEVVIEDELGMDNTYISSINKTNKSILIDNSDSKFEKEKTYTLKQINYEFDSTTYKYSFDTDLEFIVEKAPALFNTNSIEFDASANDGSFLMQVIIEDLDSVYLNEDVFLIDENNNIYEGEYIESLSKTGTNNYTFRFSVEDFGTYVFNGISFDGIDFQEFENTKVVISNGEISFIWIMMLLLILISLLLASVLFVVFNHRNKKWKKYL